MTELKSYHKVLEGKAYTVAELLVQPRKSGTRLHKQEKELAVSKVMIRMAKPTRKQQKESEDGIRRARSRI